MFARPEEMVELLWKTQPYNSDNEIRLNESRFAEELTWFFSLKNDVAAPTEDFGRVLRKVEREVVP